MQTLAPETYARLAVRSRLRERLLSLPFDGFARVVAILLKRSGFVDIRLVGRRSYRGRNGHTAGVAAGFDLAAASPVPDMLAAGGDARPAIVALKQYPPGTRVWQKQVDQLRGTALRVGASEALLVTTSSFPPSVSEGQESIHNPAAVAVLRSRAVPQVRLIDGEALLTLLIRHRVGVTEGDAAKVAFYREPDDLPGDDEIDFLPDAPGEPEVDEWFFRRVAARAAGNGPRVGRGARAVANCR